jgi:hypothetical protein
VFLVAVPIAALAFLATWLIPQVELKQWPEASAAVPGADKNAGKDAGKNAGMPVAGATVAPEALSGNAQPAQPPLTHEALDPQDLGRTDP